MRLGFCGCSHTYGTGVTNDQRFSSLVGKILDAEVTNIAQPGSSNRDIFLQSLEVLDQVDQLIVQWTYPGRQWFYPYYDYKIWSKSDDKFDYPMINDKRQKTFSEVFQLLDNSYNQYKELNQQVKILNKFSDKIYYLNAGIYIDDIFLSDQKISNYSDLAKYTKQILKVNNRYSEHVELALDEIRHYLSVIDDRWINKKRYERIDVGTDGSHPGPETHRYIAERIVEYING